RRHTRSTRDWSSDVCSSDLENTPERVFLPADVHTERVRDRRWDELRVGDRGKRHPERAVGEAGRRFGRELQRESRLPCPSWAGERQKAGSIEEAKSLDDVAVPPDERRDLLRQIVRRAIQAAEWREVVR